MTYPTCGASFYEDGRREVTIETFVSIKCTNRDCGHSEQDNCK